MLLSDGYLANGSEPWRIPERRRPARRSTRPSRPSPTTRRDKGDEPEFWPYLRDEETLARPWAIPGTPGLEHRIGGLEKGDGHGNISYDPANHDLMVRTRAGQGRPDRRVDSRRWRSTTRRARRTRAGARLGVDVRPDRRRLPPGAQRRATTSRRRTCATSTRSPRTSATSSSATTRCMVPEMNLGQLSLLLRARYLVDVVGYNHVRGLPLQGRRARRGDHRPDRDHHRTTSRAESGMSADHACPSPGCSGVPTDRRETAEPQGLHLRPGGALVPRLRRLRRAGRRAGLPARPRPAPREHRVRLRHRLLLAVPLLPRHLRHALDPRPRAGDRDRAGDHAARTCRCGWSPVTATRCRSAATT